MIGCLLTIISIWILKSSSPECTANICPNKRSSLGNKIPLTWNCKQGTSSTLRMPKTKNPKIKKMCQRKHKHTKWARPPPATNPPSPPEAPNPAKEIASSKYTHAYPSSTTAYPPTTHDPSIFLHNAEYHHLLKGFLRCDKIPEEVGGRADMGVEVVGYDFISRPDGNHIM